MAEIEYQYIHVMSKKGKTRLLLFCLILLLNPCLEAQESNIIHNPLYLRSYLVYLKGNSYYGKYEFDEALNHYNKAIRIFKKYPEPYYKMAKIHYDKRNYDTVEQYLVLSGKYKDYFRNNNDLTDYYKLSGEYYEHEEKYRKSLDNYLHYQSIISNEIIINYKTGYLYYELKQHDKSILYLEKFIHSKRIDKRFRERYSDEIKKSYMIIININMDKKKYRESLKYLKELYLYYPEKEIRERTTILSNNLKYYE